MKKYYQFIFLCLITLSGFTQTPNVLRLKIVGTDGIDEAVIRIKTGSTFGFDNSYDAYKILATSVPQIYTLLSNGTMLSINSVPEIVNEYDFSLSIKIFIDGQYNVNTTGLLSFPTTLGIFLIDQYTNTTKNLKTDSLYTFNALVSESSNRFLVRFIQRPLDVSSFSATAAGSHQINLSASPNTNNDSIVVIYNQSGVFTTPNDGNAAGNLNTSFAGGTILYKGLVGSLPNHSGLNPNQHFYYKVFSFNHMKMYSSGLAADAITTQLPVINIDSVNSFGNQLINTASTDQMYTVSGNYLNGSIRMFPSAHFQISNLGGGSFSAMDSIILTQIGGVVAPTQIFVRFLPTAVQTYVEKIAHVSIDADSVFLNVVGNGINPLKNCSITMLLQGLFNTNNNIMNEVKEGYSELPAWGAGIADKINIELHQESAPFDLVLALNNQDLHTNGLVSFTVTAAYSGNYYLKITNRNHMLTWSAIPLSFEGETINYNFTTSAIQAYQYAGGIEPQIQVAPGIYAFYLGDLDQGGWIDSDDFNLFEPALTEGIVGFVAADFNGGGWVDSDDFNLFETRLTAGTYAQFP